MGSNFKNLSGYNKLSCHVLNISFSIACALYVGRMLEWTFCFVVLLSLWSWVLFEGSILAETNGLHFVRAEPGAEAIAFNNENHYFFIY